MFFVKKSISNILNAKCDHGSPPKKPYIHGNRKSNVYHKIGTYIELIYDDGSI